MERPVCIRNKNDIGVVASVTFGGVQYKVLSPNGVLDPQPSPTQAAVMTMTKHFSYLGFELDAVNPKEKVDVRNGPPTLDELRDRSLHVVSGNPEAKGILKDVMERGQQQAKAVIDGTSAHYAALSEALKRGAPPQLEDLRDQEEKPAPQIEDALPAPPLEFSDEELTEAALLAQLGAAGDVVDEVEQELSLDGEDEDLSTLDITTLRKRAKAANIPGWRDMPKKQLEKSLRQK